MTNETVEMAPKYGELFETLIAGKREFRPSVCYDQRGDCISYFSKPVACNAEWINGFLTIYLSARTNEIVGFKLKSVKAILRLLREHGETSVLHTTKLADVLTRIQEARTRNGKMLDQRKALEEARIFSMMMRNDLGSVQIGDSLAKVA